jgi:hypothetical protein
MPALFWTSRRRQRRERTADGHIIIRQGSSEFFTEETIAERFARILQRRAHEDIKYILDHLDSTPTERLRAILRARTVAELLTLLEGELRVTEMASAELVDRPGIYASAGLAGKRVNIYLDNVVETHDLGVKTLNKKLAALKGELLGNWSMATATQEQVDRVAAFVDACVEAKQEPFFGPDEEGNFQGSSTGARITFTFADRLHFRSALLPFRRLWSPTDPAYWEATVGSWRTAVCHRNWRSPLARGNRRRDGRSIERKPRPTFRWHIREF